MLRYTETKIGTIKIEETYPDIKQRFTIEIRQGNCLAVMIHTRKTTDEERKNNPNGKYIHTLWNFYADEQHVKNMMKDYGDCLNLDGTTKIINIKLNMYYKENWKLLKYFTKSGYKVTAYYKEQKNK